MSETPVSWRRLHFTNLLRRIAILSGDRGSGLSRDYEVFPGKRGQSKASSLEPNRLFSGEIASFVSFERWGLHLVERLWRDTSSSRPDSSTDVLLSSSGLFISMFICLFLFWQISRPKRSEKSVLWDLRLFPASKVALSLPDQIWPSLLQSAFFPVSSIFSMSCTPFCCA